MWGALPCYMDRELGFRRKKKKKKGKKWERRVRSVVCDGKLELFFTSKLVKMVFRLESSRLY